MAPFIYNAEDYDVYIRLKSLPCTPSIRFRLNQLLEDLVYARRQLTGATFKLREFCRKAESIKEHIHNLQTIPGIGIVTSSTLLARIGDPQYLQNLRELGMFCGLVPREKSTGNRILRGSITHTGNTALRSLLVEAAWRTITCDKELGQFFDRIASRNNVQYDALCCIQHNWAQACLLPR